MPDGSVRRLVAWVTGASRGMGADTAIQLASAGYDVALTARDGSPLTRWLATSRRSEARRCLSYPT